jgi:transcriptional regulator with XRE-family HTH domain
MPTEGAALREWRRAQGWDGQEMARQLRRAGRELGQPVAEHSGLVRMVYGWERGDHVLSERYALIYAKAFGIPPGDLAGGPPQQQLPVAEISGDDADGIRSPVTPQAYQENPGELDFIPNRIAIKTPHAVAQDSPVIEGYSGSPIVSDRGFIEDVIDVLSRVQKLHRSTVHPEIIRHLQDNLAHTVERYGSLDHSRLVPSLLKQRGWVDSLLGECGNLAQRRQLLEIAGVTSGLLGYVAAGYGKFQLARAYCLEAFELGEFADNANIKTWGRALQSFCEYYAGRYDDALTLAKDGITYMQPGSQNAGLATSDMTLTARSFLASAYRAAGDLATAAPLHQQNLAECESTVGADHPQTLVSRANLAYLYALQDQPAPALELHQRNLADYERIHGPDHPHTLNARANLASTYRALGDVARAIELHQRSVTDYDRVYGPGHSETITARSNLAYAHQLAGDLDQAIPLHRQVLTDRERLNGSQHIYTELARQLLTRAQQPV